MAEDEGSAEAKLFGKGLAATSLLQIAIRNGIYQNQVANAMGGATKNTNMPSAKTANIYNLTSANSTTSVNSLLGRRRQRHKRNLSLGASPSTSCPPGVSSAEATTAPTASPLSTLSLDRKTFLRQKQTKQLQVSDKTWVRSDLRRGCIHVHDWLTPSYPRPVLCTVDTTAQEVALKVAGSKNLKGDYNDDLDCNKGSKHCYHDAKLPPSLLLEDRNASNSSSEALTLKAAHVKTSVQCPEDPDPFESSSDEVDLASSPTHLPNSQLPCATDPCNTSKQEKSTLDNDTAVGDNTERLITPPSKCPSSSQTRPLTSQASVQPDREVPRAAGYGQSPSLHGGAVRRLEDDEKPLQILNEYLTNLGFEDPWRVQEESMNPEIGCLIRFFFGKPRSVGGSERVQLSGVFNVRKGKLALPVNRWSKRQVMLSGTCLIVSSVKHAHTGKMHILPLIGGKVEEIKRHSHCLAFSSAGPQSQTYYISYDSYTEHLRWHRTASKIVSQRVNSVDLSCCSLEELPTQLFYSQDLTHLNLKNNFLSLHKGVPALTRFCNCEASVCLITL
ncbi:hypothetical protein WMY93_025428 [Mugilogobius chulae]|uniref:PHLPP-like RA domain-containing protein n=1 Tax=Mugilogobius chulae TaxID=88201 RepID=A0AAW0N3H9_9GOBI